VADGVDFGILGPILVRSGGVVARIPAGKQRAVLATLLARAGETVPSSAIIDSVWGENPPASAGHLVQVYVSQLRNALQQVGLEGRLLTEHNGYRLQCEADELDSARFEALAHRGTVELEAGDAAAAAATLRSALEIWRGAALVDAPVEGEPARRASELDAQRLRVHEQRIQADLDCGGGAALVPELTGLVAAYPLRETLRAQLMVALYRAGRQADALAVYQDARRTLVDELGIEPGPRLRELEGRVLRHDASLDVAAAPLEGEAGAPGHDAEGRRRWLIVAGIGIAAASAVAAIAIILAKDRPPGTVVVPAHGVAVVDERGTVVTHARSFGTSPGRLSYGAGGLWVGDLDAHTLSLVDPVTLRAKRVIGLPDTPSVVATAGAIVWLSYSYSGRIGRYLVRTDTLTQPIRPTPTATGLAALAPTERDIWVGQQDGTVLALDPVSLRVRASSKAGRYMALGVNSTAVWGVGFASPDVARMDRSTAKVVYRVPVNGGARALAADERDVWVATADPDRLYRIDARTSQVTLTIPLGRPPSALVIGRDAIWIASGSHLERIDPGAGELTRTLEVHHPVLALTADQRGHVYVATG
jgi:DNA-binding SARP family transcriptional activator/streptogramin lyase